MSKDFTKLIYITNARIPTDKAHGIQIVQSCQAFAKQGLAVQLIIPKLITAIKDDPFAYYGLDKNFAINKTFVIQASILKRLFGRFAIYIEMLSFSGIALLRHWHKRRDTSTIYYSRDKITLWLMSVLGFRFVAEIHDYRSAHPQWFYKSIFKKALCIIVNSNGTKQALTAHYDLDQGILHVAPNGVDLGFFNVPFTSQQAREKLGLPLHKTIIGYTGRLEIVGHEKGITTLLESFAQISADRSDVFLYIVGGPQDKIDQYKKYAHALQINDDAVRFAGHIPYEDMPLQYKALDIGVIPLPQSQHAKTTSPMKLFEYMAAGLPMVVADVAGVREHVLDHEAVFFEPSDTASLTQQLQLVLNDAQLRTTLQNASYANAQKHTWQQRAHAIVEHIRQRPLRICYFGDYDPAYSRNRVIIQGLKQNGVTVIECNVASKSPHRFWKLLKRHRLIKNQYDILIVGHTDHRFITILAACITSKPVVMDGFYSVYESYLFDRKLFGTKSFKAWYHWSIEWLACKLCSHILCDTNEHIDYFAQTYSIDTNKFTRIFIGADDSIFKI